MDKYKVELSSYAQIEINSIYNYYVNNHPDAPILAQRIYGKLSRSVQSLDTMPHRYRKFTTNNTTIHLMPVDDYIIMYEIFESPAKRVFVTHIIHAKQDYMRFLDKL